MNTHEVLIEILQNNGPSSISKLSELACLTKADIRYHMKSLVHGKRVTITKPQIDSGRGRPAQVYSVTEKVDSKLLLVLSSAMFNAAKQTFIEASSTEQFTHTLLDILTVEFKPMGSINMRLGAAVNYLSDLGINARWEASLDGPQIKILKESISNLIPDQDFSRSFIIKLVDRLFSVALSR